MAIRELAVTAALASAACDASPIGEWQSPIVNGEAAPDDVAVVGLITGGHVSCTGTLIAERVILTAAHCVTDPPVEAIDVLFGQGIDGDAVVVGATGRQLHPAFDPILLVNDLALLSIDSPPSGVAPVPMVPGELGDAFIGSEIRIVGFGHTGPEELGAHVRRWGTARVAALGAREFRFEPSPSLTCVGDAGGPAFATFDGAEYLVGVSSYGDASCEAVGADVRVDAYLADFIEPRVAELSVSGPESRVAVGGCSAASGQGSAPGVLGLVAVAIGLAIRRQSEAGRLRGRGRW